MEKVSTNADGCESNDSLVSENDHANQNLKWIVCKLCQSKILRPQSAQYAEKEFFLPYMQKKNQISGSSPEGESLKKFWLVGDMWTFENVGFSNTVANIKYLTCADCEVGPIGWHDVMDTTKFYVSLDRVQEG